MNKDYRIGLRMTKKEYEHLQQVAAKMECSISQAARLILAEATVVSKTELVPVTTRKIDVRTFVKRERSSTDALAS